MPKIPWGKRHGTPPAMPLRPCHSHPVTSHQLFPRCRAAHALLGHTKGALCACPHCTTTPLPPLQPHSPRRGTSTWVRAPPSLSRIDGGVPGWQPVPLTCGSHPKSLPLPAPRAGSSRGAGQGARGTGKRALPCARRAAAPRGPPLSHPTFLHPLGFPSWVPASPVTLRGAAFGLDGALKCNAINVMKTSSQRTHGARRSSRDGSRHCPSSGCSLPVQDQQQLCSLLPSLAFLRPVELQCQPPGNLPHHFLLFHNRTTKEESRLLLGTGEAGAGSARRQRGGEAGMQELLGPLAAGHPPKLTCSCRRVSQPGWPPCSARQAVTATQLGVLYATLRLVTGI